MNTGNVLKEVGGGRLLLRNGARSTNKNSVGDVRGTLTNGGRVEIGPTYRWEMGGWPPETCETPAIPQALMSWHLSATHNVDICFQLEHIN